MSQIFTFMFPMVGALVGESIGLITRKDKSLISPTGEVLNQSKSPNEKSP